MLPTTRYKTTERKVRSLILPLLREHVFHVTSYPAFKKILTSGDISPNIGGQFGNAFPGSQNSYGRYKGYVCLFDFRDKTDEAVNRGIDDCNFLEAQHLGNRHLFLILKPTAYSSLIPTETAYKEVEHRKLHIPVVECWFPTSIPLESVSRVLDVSIRRRPIKPGSLLWEIMESYKTDSNGHNSPTTPGHS